MPVDYVAAAMDHIAHKDGLDGQAFHLVNPKMQEVGDVMNTFASAGHAPQMVMRVDKQMTDMLPKGRAVLRDEAAGAEGHPALAAGRPRACPTRSSSTSRLSSNFDARDTRRALEGSGIELPPLETYSREALGLLGAQPRPRPVQGPLVRGRRQRQDRDHHRRLERHRPGGRAQDRRGGRDPAAGGALRGQAARGEGGDRAQRRDGLLLPRRPLRLRLDRRAGREDPLRARRDRHARQQRGPLDPALGGVLLRPLPRLRAHDQAQLPRARSS